MTNGPIVAGKFQIVRPLGRGGMGAVYDAIHLRTGRRVAVKIMAERLVASGGAALERFAREAKAAAAVDSLHVVQVLDCGEDDASGLPFIVMEHLDGEDLRSRLARGALAPERASAIAIEVCRGLARAHAAEIIHRDLKPANIFLARIDDREVVKILDFGIAKLVDDAAALTKTGDVLGSVRYMSPEQRISPRDVDARTDLWSVGIVLFEMVTGRVPAKSADVADELRDVPPALAAVITRALAVDRERRFASAEEMLAELTRTASPPPKRARRWPHVAVVATGALALAVAAVVAKPADTEPSVPAARMESAPVVPPNVTPALSSTAANVVQTKPAAVVRRPPAVAPRKPSPPRDGKTRDGRDGRDEL